MRSQIAVLSVGLAIAFPAISAQAQTRADSVAKARRDSIAAADSIKLVRELEKMQSGSSGNQPPAQATGQVGPSNSRLLPDISAVGDFVADLSPKRSTYLANPVKRIDVREVEVAVQAAVDPYFRGDMFLGFNDAEGVAIEQAYLTTTALPNQFEAKIGRFLMPFGKANLTHRHDLHSVEYPWVIQRFFGDEGLKGTGVWLSRVFSPLGFFQEVQVTAVDRFGEPSESLTTEEPANKSLAGLAYSARLRNYWDLSEASNMEISATALTGKREQPIASMTASAPLGDFNAVNARQTVYGADFTYRWRPLQQGLYRSFILQAEFLRQMPENNPMVPVGTQYLGPTNAVNGAYAFSRYQVTQRGYIGGRYDYVQAPDKSMDNFQAASAYLEFFPSEFSKFILSYERGLQGALQSGFAEDKVNRIMIQGTFSLGPHKPHPF